MMKFRASLYLVPTPIGNLADITLRALEVLKSVDLILAEDTRTTTLLLEHYEISQPLRSYHVHNEHRQTEKIIEELSNGKTMALVSDAGAPAISDPGFLLVRTCLEHNIAVECLPGATAFVPALICSGLPCDKFIFEGFLSVRKGRKARIELLAAEKRTMIFYESPHRLLRTLGQFAEYFGTDRQASVSRELSKMFEETVHGSLKEIIEHFAEKKIRGEIVIVVGGNTA